MENEYFISHPESEVTYDKSTIGDSPILDSYISNLNKAQKEWAFSTGNEKSIRDTLDAIPNLELRQYEPFEYTHRFNQDDDYAFNPPYGIIGLATQARTKEQIEDLVEYCKVRANLYMEQGNWNLAKYFMLRQQIIRGLLTGQTKFYGKLPFMDTITPESSSEDGNSRPMKSSADI